MPDNSLRANDIQSLQHGEGDFNSKPHLQVNGPQEIHAEHEQLKIRICIWVRVTEAVRVQYN